MVSQNGIRLASYLISSYFGDLSAKVCECLLRRGTLPLAQIIRFTELSRENVRNSLLVLIHHNCVQAFTIQQEGAFGEVPKVATQYMALFENIIHHMRFPKFVQIVLEELGKECEEIFEGLLQHGRLSLNQIVDRHKQTSNLGHSGADGALDSFRRLVDARFVERCPAPEPFLAPPADGEAPSKKRGARAGKTPAEQESIEQRALAAAGPMESLRFLIEMDICSEDSQGKGEQTCIRTKVGEKRKQDPLESGAEPQSNDDRKEVFWRVNFEEFIRLLRHKACVENVKARHDDQAALVLKAILKLSRTSETKVRMEHSVPLTINAIYAEVIKEEAGLGMNLESIGNSLVQLGCQLPMIGTDEVYSIDLRSIVQLAQLEEVESIVLKRYGREAYRMFRLLSKADRLLETDKIADTTFVEKKDTIRILYKLWKDEYMEMKKVNVQGAKQSELLLWKVNKQSLWGHVLDEMYHAALNLRLRIAHEQEQEKEILQIPREKLVGELGQRYKRLRRVRIILESSLMNLDDALMLFHDF